MRQIVLDTETTGLAIEEGHRIIEIGCVELLHRRFTGNNFHCYFNPGREIDLGALQVHGLTNEFLTNKPMFHDVCEDLITFLAGAELIIHNAPFDIGFLNYELQNTGKNFKNINEYCSVIDTLILARQKHPGQQNNLDALCKRYQVDNSAREFHGALLDARLLADVYLAMTGGQTNLFNEVTATEKRLKPATVISEQAFPLRVIQTTDAEEKAHRLFLEKITKASDGKNLW